MGAVLCDGRFGDEPAPAEKAGLADLEIAAHRAPPFVLSSCSYLFVAVRFISLHFVSIFQNLGDGSERSPRRWDSGEKRGGKSAQDRMHNRSNDQLQTTKGALNERLSNRY